MTTLANLKLVAVTKPTVLAPIVQKRNKLIKRLQEQVELATALAEGREYVVTRLRTVIDDETKITKTVSAPKRIKQWWWTAANGKVCINLRYGAKVIELAKGMSAVELNSKDELVGVLTTLKGAVESGELDTAIEKVAGAVKSNFKK